MRKSIFFLLLTSFSFVVTGCDISDRLFRYYNSKGNTFFENSAFAEAKSEYQKAIESSQKRSYLAKNNMGTALYEERNFEEAQTLFESISSRCEGKAYCDEMFYNLGNSLYRIGESKDDFEDKRSYWIQAIAAYEKTLEINPEDTQAKENIEFIKKKLQELEQQQSQQSQSQQGQNSEEEQQGSGSQNQQNQSEEGEEQGTPQRFSNEIRLDESLNNQVDEYLKQLEQNEKNLQQHFQRVPQENQNTADPFDDMFNDPFFDNFFQGTPFERNVRGTENQQEEKDW